MQQIAWANNRHKQIMQLKLKPLVYTTALLILGTGCVGYNHTLFMTKSNAGLDVDTKPPTAEVTIGRKEVVITPVFEGGKTPPVMASFGANSDVGNSLTRFLFGVDQTFAGGDAATAMTKLYSDTTAVSKTDHPTNYDSKISINGSPDAGRNWFTKFFFALHNTNDSRPLVFGTDTSLGVKAGWSGVSGQIPDRVHVGFNRKEMAYAPVFGERIEQGTKTAVRIPSFLATADFTSKVGGAGDNSVSYIQYFATGDAATRLAMQPAVRQAMLQRADPLASAKADKLASIGVPGPDVVKKKVATANGHASLKQAESKASLDAGIKQTAKTNAEVASNAAKQAKDQADAKATQSVTEANKAAALAKTAEDAKTAALAAQTKATAELVAEPGNEDKKKAKTAADTNVSVTAATATQTKAAAAAAAADAATATTAYENAKAAADKAAEAFKIATLDAELAARALVTVKTALTNYEAAIEKATGRAYPNLIRYGNALDINAAFLALQEAKLLPQ